MPLPFYILSLIFFVSAFDGLFTVDEKAKLYTAIGYSETAANPNLPKNVSHFPLKSPHSFMMVGFFHKNIKTTLES